MNVSIYQMCFDLIHTYIYGGVELTSDMSLVATILSTAACVFCFALPFLIVTWFVKGISGGFFGGFFR